MALPKHGKKAQESGTKRYQNPPNGTKRYHFSAAIPAPLPRVLPAPPERELRDPDAGTSDVTAKKGAEDEGQVGRWPFVRMLPEQFPNVPSALSEKEKSGRPS